MPVTLTCAAPGCRNVSSAVWVSTPEFSGWDLLPGWRYNTETNEVVCSEACANRIAKGRGEVAIFVEDGRWMSGPRALKEHVRLKDRDEWVEDFGDERTDDDLRDLAALVQVNTLEWVADQLRPWDADLFDHIVLAVDDIRNDRAPRRIERSPR